MQRDGQVVDQSDADAVDAYKTRLWEYARLNEEDPDAYPWKVARIREYVGCTLRALHEHKNLRDLFWNVRRILEI